MSFLIMIVLVGVTYTVVEMAYNFIKGTIVQ